jgi:Fe-S oxidoreductase
MLTGVTQHRAMPPFPNQSFKQWLDDRSEAPLPGRHGRGEVVLWADTFNNYFMPHTAKAALEVLEHAGFRVTVPRQHLCCGRPLYDFGMLEEAKKYLRKVMASLAREIAAGTPIVCLEPSCASVFRDEIKNLFPNDETAARLQKQVVLFADFLDSAGYKPPRFSDALRGGKALVHGHCHHKALWSMSPEQRLLRDTGLAPEVLDSGCCGLAGSFGYESEHYDISMKIGERKLLPLVRSAERKTMIVADGFSCRQQIAHGTPRRAMHIAEVLQMALHPGMERPKRSGFIEAGHTQSKPGYPILAVFAAIAGLSISLLYLGSRRKTDDNAS